VCLRAEEASKLACDSANRWIDNAEALRVRCLLIDAACLLLLS
jgi:hypothetical protein